MRQADIEPASSLRQQPDIGALVAKKFVSGVMGPDAVAKISASMRANQAPSAGHTLWPRARS